MSNTLKYTLSVISMIALMTLMACGQQDSEETTEPAQNKIEQSNDSPSKDAQSKKVQNKDAQSKDMQDYDVQKNDVQKKDVKDKKTGLTKITIYDTNFRVVAVLEDPAELATLNQSFMDKKATLPKNPVRFKYRLDMLIDGEHQQWLYQDGGKIQLQRDRTAPIYQLQDWKILTKYIAM